MPDAPRLGLLLFAHGARDPGWATPFKEIQRRLLAAGPTWPVELAFLEWMAPTLDQAAERLVAQGVATVLVVPLFMAQGGHIKQDLPRLLAELGQRHPAVTFRVTSAVGEIPEILDALAGWIGREGQNLL